MEVASASQAASSVSTNAFLARTRCTVSEPSSRRTGGWALSASVSMAVASLAGSPGCWWLTPAAKVRMAPTVSAYASMRVAVVASDEGARKSVRKKPGSTTVTFTPSGASSSCNASLNASTANLVAL